MRNILFIIFLFPVLGYAQDNNLQIPSSPAFSILNFEPSAALKPSSESELIADVLNSIDKNGKFKPNVGFEFTPYWLKSRPELSYEEYVNNQGLLKRSLTISLASVYDSLSDKEKVGVGLRFKLRNGKETQEYTDKKKELSIPLNITSITANLIPQVGSIIKFRNQAIDSIESQLVKLEYSPNIISIFLASVEDIKGDFDDSSLSIKAFLRAINEQLINSNGELIKKVAELSKEKDGWVLELAGATSFINSNDDGSLEKIGVWLNASNKLSANGDYLLFNLRYQFATKDSTANNIDLGFSYLKKMSSIVISTELFLRSYAIQFQETNMAGVEFTAIERDITYRIAANAAYKVNDYISVNINLGKGFNSPFQTNATLFSSFGISYNFNRKVLTNL